MDFLSLGNTTLLVNDYFDAQKRDIGREILYNMSYT